MATTKPIRKPSLGLPHLVDVLLKSSRLEEVMGALARGTDASVDGAWGSGCALALAAVAQLCMRLAPGGAQAAQPERTSPTSHEDEGAERPGVTPATGTSVVPPVLMIVLPRTSEVDDFAGDLASFSGRPPLVLPAWEGVPQRQGTIDPVLGDRLRTLHELARVPAPIVEKKSGTSGSLAAFRKKQAPNPAAHGPAPGPGWRVLVTSFPALLQPVPHRAELSQVTRTVSRGERLDPEDFIRWLMDRGFSRVAGLQYPGECALHGGILDLYAPLGEPLRIEFFGDEIESIRTFDLETQRKVHDLATVGLVLWGSKDGARPEVAKASQSALPAPLAEPSDWGTESVIDSLPAGSVVALVDPVELIAEGRSLLNRLANPRGYFGVEATLARCAAFPTLSIDKLASAPQAHHAHLHLESIERFALPAQQAVDELKRVVDGGEQVLIACHNAGERERLDELLAATEGLRREGVHLCEGQVLRGFRLADEGLTVLSDHELFGRRDIRRAPIRKARIESRPIDSFLELTPGDHVVHLTKGIARYRGMELTTKDNEREEHLVLEFRDHVKVYVPVTLIHLVQKYVGGAKMTPTLSRLGTGTWERRKAAVADAVADLASDMLKLQAERAARPGFAFPPDTHWQEEFEASFPYTPTDDQVSSIAAVKDDMQRPKPMDRLICGDVGYGKTEVAIRAAFKAIDAGKQVAVLVPTTVLAEQHYRTFLERMAEYPFTVEVLSRFRSKGEQRKVLAQLATGGVDVVIGTHRIVQADVRFSDLGLLIIDEEQRFGVEAKDMLKKLRLEVDVLTLSATPIPRTLHLSLLGIRDISNLQTPPHDRLAVETQVCRFDKELIRRAVIRELNRGGQVYFVHNRVYNIEEIADQLQTIVPEARLGIVHGQMAEEPLEAAMIDFVQGRIDILVATTIIESGLDIPNANTIFIHQADQYGLSDLHQLRGRVGRYKHRAYCYLLLDASQSISSTAAKRLKAIEEFSELGAGFKIAMRDLEIRGAGNILGTEQSGHIASVGYELYCQLLENAARRLRNEPVRELARVAINLPLSAYLPDDYVPPGRVKVEVYRRLTRIAEPGQLNEMATELRDRFGPMPEPVHNLLELQGLQLAAQTWQIDDIHLEDNFVVFGYQHAGRIHELAKKSSNRLRIVDDKQAYLALDAESLSPAQLMLKLKALLQAR